MTASGNINFINFNMSIGKKKPHTINGEQSTCPFCAVDKLTHIIETQGDIILLENKYNVLESARQLVLIEGADCHSDMPHYTLEKMHDLIRFGLRHWLSMAESGKYQSVIFFKNFGPLSGGTIQHPHMQIVAFPEINHTLLYDSREFEGIPVHQENGIKINLGTRPRIGFFEINILAEKKWDSALLSAENYITSPTAAAVKTLSRYIQIAIRFLNDLLQRPNLSYNLFFYLQDDCIRVKILPRFATSPLYIGYNIHLVPNNMNDLAEKLTVYF